MLSTTTVSPRRYTTRSGSSGSSISKPADVRSGVACRPRALDGRARASSRIRLLSGRAHRAHSLGCGSHGSDVLAARTRTTCWRRRSMAEARQPSRSSSAPPERTKTGSWRASSGRSSTWEAELLAGIEVHASRQPEHEQGRRTSPPRKPVTVSTAAWELSNTLSISEPWISASARPNRVTARWASWLLSVPRAGVRPASAPRPWRSSPAVCLGVPRARRRSKANDWWNSSFAYSTHQVGTPWCVGRPPAPPAARDAPPRRRRPRGASGATPHGLRAGRRSGFGAPAPIDRRFGATRGRGDQPCRRPSPSRAEAVDAAVEPEAQHAVEVVDDIGVVPVEVRLSGVNSARYHCPGSRPARRPGSRPSRRRSPASCSAARPLRRLDRREAEAARAADPLSQPSRLAEPGVVGAAVVGDHVHHDPDAARSGRPDKRVELAEVAVVGLDVEVVGDVVPVIGLRRG